MVDFKGLADKAKDLIAGNKEKVEEAVDKLGDTIDSKTGGKYSAVVDKVQDAAKGVVEKQGGAEHKDAPEGGDSA